MSKTAKFLRRGALRALVLGLFLHAAPSNSGAVAELRVDGFSAEDIHLIEELATWIDTDPRGGEALRSAIRQHPRSFEVFRRFHNETARAAVLANLPFTEAIRAAARRYRIDPLLLSAIVEVESGFQPAAVSSCGALGLMQVMPPTAEKGDEESLLDPEVNLDNGAHYLRTLLDTYHGDLELALAAYNAGPGNVARFGGMPPFRETQHYVDRVLEIYVAHHRQVWLASETAELLAEL